MGPQTPLPLDAEALIGMPNRSFCYSKNLSASPLRYDANVPAGNSCHFLHQSDSSIVQPQINGYSPFVGQGSRLFEDQVPDDQLTGFPTGLSPAAFSPPDSSNGNVLYRSLPFVNSEHSRRRSHTTTHQFEASAPAPKSVEFSLRLTDSASKVVGHRSHVLRHFPLSSARFSMSPEVFATARCAGSRAGIYHVPYTELREAA